MTVPDGPRVNYVNPPPTSRRSRSTLGGLAKGWGVRELDVYDAVVALGIRARSMSATVSPADEKRIQDQLFSQTRMARASVAVPVGMPTASSKRGLDKSAYLTASAARAARIEAAERVDVDLCSCCEIPLPSRAHNGDLCEQCISAGHREIRADRDMVLAREHADRFRADYLRERERVAEAETDARASTARANRWTAALVRTVVDHNLNGKFCPICTTPAPCAVWRRLRRVNPGIADRVLNDFYPLHPAQLDEKLDDGIDSTSDD